MTPKEKAKELYHKFQVYEVNGEKRMQYGPQVKVFALIALDEILELIDHTPLADEDYAVYLINRWEQIKQEIEKL